MYTFMNPHPKGCLVGDCVRYESGRVEKLYLTD